MDFLKTFGKILAVLIITFIWVAVSCGGTFTLYGIFSHSSDGYSWLRAIPFAVIISTLVWIGTFYWSIKYIFFWDKKSDHTKRDNCQPTECNDDDWL